jgi:hypothetical protein
MDFPKDYWPSDSISVISHSLKYVLSHHLCTSYCSGPGKTAMKWKEKKNLAEEMHNKQQQ